MGDCSTIVYGINGVCHQMLNCVLTGSDDKFKCYVNNAPSFWASWALYGCFGNVGKRLYTKRKPNSRLAKLHAVYAKKAPFLAETEYGFDAQSLLEPADTMDGDFAADVSDFTALQEPEAPLVEKAMELSLGVEQTRSGLSIALLRGEISPTDFATALNKEAQRAADAWQDLAPQTRFEGETLSKYAIIDPELMRPADVYGEIGERIGL